MTLKGCTGSTPVPGTKPDDPFIRFFYINMFYVYILMSEKNGRYYVGYSESPERRLFEHNSGKVKSTRPHRPWRKVYSESYLSETEAMRRELEIKAKKSRSYITWLIAQDTSR